MKNQTQEQVKEAATGVRYYFNEEKEGILWGVYILCDCGQEIRVEEMDVQEIIQCENCRARYAATYIGWKIIKLRREGLQVNGDGKENEPNR